MKETFETEGEHIFFAFSFLMNGARFFRTKAVEQNEGSAFAKVSAMLFSAFAFEATLNHIGARRLPFWSNVERKLPWEAKLRFICHDVNHQLDFGKRPFQTVDGLFKFRDKMAHGRTQKQAFKIQHQDESSIDRIPLGPDWLQQYLANDMVERVFDDVKLAIETLLESAGFSKYDLDLLGQSIYMQTTLRDSIEPGNERVVEP